MPKKLLKKEGSKQKKKKTTLDAVVNSVIALEPGPACSLGARHRGVPSIYDLFRNTHSIFLVPRCRWEER
jgi:hypothetical protein